MTEIRALPLRKGIDATPSRTTSLPNRRLKERRELAEVMLDSPYLVKEQSAARLLIVELARQSIAL